MRADHLSYVLSRYEAQPDLHHAPITKPIHDERKRRKYKTRRRYVQDAEMITITDDIHVEIVEEMKRTKVGPVSFFVVAKEAPPGLDSQILSSWISKEITEANKSHLEFVRNYLKTLPSKKGGVSPENSKRKRPTLFNKQELTPEILKKLRGYVDDKYLPKQLFTFFNDTPDSLYPGKISNWLTGTQKTACKEHIEYVLEGCEKMKAYYELHTEVITDDIRESLLFHRNRTGIKPGKLLSYADKIPDGLTSYMISTWLSKNVTTARKDHLLFVQENYEKMPSQDQTAKERLAQLRTGDSSEKDYIELTEEVLYHLFTHKVRTGVSPKRLLQDKNNIPAGLEAHDVNAWMKRAYQRIPKSHYLYIIEEWGKVPSKIQ